MRRFEEVKKALEDKTRDTLDFVTLTKNVDARHSGKYAIRDALGTGLKPISYKTLEEVVKAYDL